MYYIGTIKRDINFKGKVFTEYVTTFPFIDSKNNVRAIQAKRFDDNNHTGSTDFVHAIIERNLSKARKPTPKWIDEYKKNEIKVSCLFGEHLLLKYPLNPIALVEAPKTAIYGALYFGFPKNDNDLLWLAVYNLSSLGLKRCRILQDRDVYLFPDLSMNGRAFKLWKDKAQIIERELPGSRFVISDLLEKNASDVDRLNGLDLADFLIKQDWRKFRK